MMSSVPRKMTVNLSEELYQKLLINAEKNAVSPATRARQLINIILSDDVIEEKSVIKEEKSVIKKEKPTSKNATFIRNATAKRINLDF